MSENSSSETDQMLNNECSQDILSPRAIEILTWLAQGKTYAEIATILSISGDTVKDYIERIGKKLNTSNKTHTVALAISRGIIKRL